MISFSPSRPCSSKVFGNRWSFAMANFSFLCIQRSQYAPSDPGEVRVSLQEYWQWLWTNHQTIVGYFEIMVRECVILFRVEDF
jgi:hypothetical protein